MKFLNRGIGLAFGALALGMAGGAGAQENLDQGKSGAQLFASDCAICHKTTAGLSKGRLLGLDGFLREHYTASRESAAAIAAYVQATDKGAPAPGPAKLTKKGVGKSDAKGDDKTKGSEKKSDGGKPADGKSGDSKPADAKPAEAKPSEAKPSEAKPSEAKPSEAKSAEPEPSQAKPNENKPSDGQPPDIYKPEKKSD